MSDPYEILGVPPSADETEVRKRYLELVREFPPDRAPDRFAAIRAAYDDLRDPIRRIERQLFHPTHGDSLTAIEADLRARLRDVRVPLSVMLAWAESS